jgi:hypothetical protein
MLLKSNYSLKHISKAKPQHHGWEFIRRPLDFSALERESVKNLAFVIEPLRELPLDLPRMAHW